MDSRIIELTSAAHKHGNLNIAACGRSFFPQDVYGAPCATGGKGVPIRLRVKGLPNTILTDIPTQHAGKPRWLFRERAWVREFVRRNRYHHVTGVTHGAHARRRMDDEDPAVEIQQLTFAK